jgi:ABC-2 type transport system permease protein/lipopolysaccharide transport system permease protein
MMNPMLYMVILSFVFSNLMKVQVENFAAFILSGIMIWNLFSQSLGIGVNSILANGSLLRKVKVPAALFPAASVLSVLINFILALGPYLIVSAFIGVKLTPWILALPIVLIPYIVFIYGIALFLGTLNVRFRDIGHVLDPLLLMIFYGSPIIYQTSQLPDKFRVYAELNPLSHFLEQIRAIMFFGQPPSIRAIGVMTILALVSFLLGLYTYRSSKDRFIYHL